MKRQFKLLKDTPAIKANAVFEEMCDDGTQDFICKDSSFFIFPEVQSNITMNRKYVVDNTDWFEEQVPMYVPKQHYEKFMETIKNL